MKRYFYLTSLLWASCNSDSVSRLTNTYVYVDEGSNSRMICKDPSSNKDNYIPCDVVELDYNDSYIIAKQQYFSDCYQKYKGGRKLEEGNYYYWIIKISNDSLIGPLTKAEFKQTIEEMKIPDKLRLD